MKTQSIELTKLEADDGMLLTNGESYGRVVYLGVGDSPENWWEIPQKETDGINQEEQTDG